MTDVCHGIHKCNCKCSKLTRVCIVYFIRASTGLLLIIISSVAARYYNSEINEKYGSVFPYFIGGFVTGLAMTIFDLVNYRIWIDIYHGTATSKQKAHWVRSGTVISVISVIFAMTGSIIDGIFGIQTPYECRKYLTYEHARKCTEAEYQMTNTYKVAIILLLLLFLSIIVNTVYICQPDPFQSDSSRQSGTNIDGQVPVRDDTVSSLVSTHGQQEPFQQSLMSAEYQRPMTQKIYSYQVPDSDHDSAGFVLNTRHGHPEPFAGAILSTGNDGPIFGGPSGFLLNTRRGQPEPFAGAILSTGNNRSVINEPSEVVLNTRHGQPEPFAGVILSSSANQQISINNLVLELQEQNRLLREQLAIQQQQQQQQRESTDGTADPSVSVSESPPSYESLLSSQ